jgi:hypothetical protein
VSTFTCRRCSRKKNILHYPYLYLYRQPLLSPLTNCSPAFSPYGPIRLCIVAGGTCFALACATLAMFFGFRAASRLHPGIRSLAFTILFLLGTAVFSKRCINSSDVLGFVGKDATLTGRTLIWPHALDSISEHPIGRTQVFGILAGRQLERGASPAFYENSQQNGVSLP